MNQAQIPSWQKVRSTFQQIWGYEDFRSPQGEIIQSLLEKKRHTNYYAHRWG